MALPRFTFGSDFIGGGFPFLPVLIGIFAFAQIMTDVEKLGRSRRAAAALEPAARACPSSHLKVIGEILGRPFLLLWSTIVGIAHRRAARDRRQRRERDGLRPGEEVLQARRSGSAPATGGHHRLGSPPTTPMSAARSSPSWPSAFPGDAVTAVMLGAMTIHGIQSGPLFVSQNPQLAYGIYAAYILAHPADAADPRRRRALRCCASPACALAVLAPVVLVLCVIGAYALNNTMQSVYVLLLFGVLGYALVKLGFPLAPLILGLILGDQIEINLVRAIMTDSNPWLFITRPISGGAAARLRALRRAPSGSICGIRSAPKRRRSRTSKRLSAWSMCGRRFRLPRR